jgi:hypothetical protein
MHCKIYSLLFENGIVKRKLGGNSHRRSCESLKQLVHLRINTLIQLIMPLLHMLQRDRDDYYVLNDKQYHRKVITNNNIHYVINGYGINAP